ncbi:3-phosphoserine/phosphohydroxythreonine transaminase [Alteromonas sp. C1M14]|uniref:3-phosphoserine/phosphohydroxythreonine transaminase n=1 Tax=Alteromonas sp. C1M14 TaxID=2841567 RepID=UPI001C088F8C|nr:3-phosphoserine/phosphohydroxythreonine transaminase [Alteromonas sp. C1M14]MBU2976804.1 3-phosphoserine/phosphohydroxythreonine transaminase [Alteromonas sp. C1M14]
MNKVFNFSAGPAMLPAEVMAQAQSEFLNWQGSGCSVMEVSHRGKAFIEVAATAEQDLRDLLAVPDNYKVLFAHGGGRGQFASVPLNISNANDTSLHLVTGSWSKGAVAEASKYNQAKVVGETIAKDGLQFVPKLTANEIDPSAAYLHFCPNETVDGIAFDWLPQSGDVPLVSDMSSCILSQPLDVSRHGIIYAGAQKNIGPSGLSVLIVRDDLIGKARKETPSIFNYELMAKHDSMYNTPPTFSWYLAGLVFKWLKANGGLEAMAQRNKEKAALLYSAIDSSDFYSNPVHPENRSRMNVPFHLADDSLNALFLEESSQAGLMALKGHRSVGGMRASIYNAMPIDGVVALVDFMQQFEKKHG